MSNLGQFYGSGFPLGSSLTMTWLGDLYAPSDGTVWMANTITAPFAYSAVYAALPDILKVPYPLMTGPNNGLWMAAATASLAYSASGTIYCFSSAGYNSGSYVEGDSTNGYTYYTSTDGGQNWTKRTFPNTKAYSVGFTAGLFVGLAASSTTNGIIVGTDAVSWTAKTSASQADVSDIVSNGGANIVIYPRTGTVANVSNDSGATFASATITTVNNSIVPLGRGSCTWNAGAGLFIGNTNTGGIYQTSPTGATWTLRNAQATFLPYGNVMGGSNLFASNATTTVAMGLNGFFATTTDGLAWANHGFIAVVSPTTSLISALYWDGARFVAAGPTRIFYSANGVSWTEGRAAPGGSGGILVAGDRVVRPMSTSSTIPGKALLVTDPTATTPLTVSALGQTGLQSANVSYTRIK